MRWVTMPDATLTIEPRPLAERLRIRKGHIFRLTGFDGVPQDFEVTYVSMPDSAGRCEVRLDARP